MTPSPKCPLNDQHCQMLNNLLQECADTRCLLDQLEKLGLDVSNMRAQSDANEAFARATKATYFPNHP